MIELLILAVLCAIAIRLWQLPSRADLNAMTSVLLSSEVATRQVVGRLEEIEASAASMADDISNMRVRGLSSLDPSDAP